MMISNIAQLICLTHWKVNKIIKNIQEKKIFKDNKITNKL